MKEDFTEKTITKSEDGVQTQKTVGKDGDKEWESTKVTTEDVAPMYKETVDENGRRRGTADWGSRPGVIGEEFETEGRDGLGDEDKAWLEVLWRSPSDTESRYHRAIQDFKKSRGLGNDEEARKEVCDVFGLDENEQAVDYPTKEGMAFLKKAVERPKLEEKEEDEYGE